MPACVHTKEKIRVCLYDGGDCDEKERGERINGRAFSAQLVSEHRKTINARPSRNRLRFWPCRKSWSKYGALKQPALPRWVAARLLHELAFQSEFPSPPEGLGEIYFFSSFFSSDFGSSVCPSLDEPSELW